MHTRLQKIVVPFEYPVVFTSDLFNIANNALVDVVRRQEPNRLHRTFFVIDDGVYSAWPNLKSDIAAYLEAHSETFAPSAEPHVVIGGEPAKSDPTEVTRLQELLFHNRLDRQSFVVVIGGGAVLDMAGYAASTIHRGLRMIRVPTTVLAQNDSGVGVKNGINAFDTKNFLGTFAPPFAVLNDFSFLATLEHRDLMAGTAEAIKVALIRDGVFFDWLEQNVDRLCKFEDETASKMVRKGAELHLEHIATSGDPFEFGMARPLDFGHWSAHKLESMTGYALRHGEAVAIGMALDAYYSVEAGLLSPEDCERIAALLEGLGLALWDDALDRIGPDGRLEVLKGLDEFREHLGGELTVTLLQGIGQGLEVHTMDEGKIVRCVERLRARRRG
jgi:3-dehydroquinate synthase